jgi:hypothetical protein
VPELGESTWNRKRSLLRRLGTEIDWSRMEERFQRRALRTAAERVREGMAYMVWIPCASLSQRSKILMKSASALI